MGGAACAEIILNGTLAYGVIEKFSTSDPRINIFSLEAALNASCEVVSYASLYFTIEGEDKLTNNYTTPIIHLHREIVKYLSSEDRKGSDRQTIQAMVNNLTMQLETATRKLLELFD